MHKLLNRLLRHELSGTPDAAIDPMPLRAIPEAPTDSMPENAVVAFNRSESEGPCPHGWKLFSHAGGRFIIGAGGHNNEGLSSYTSFGTNREKAVGGHEAQQINTDNLPNVSYRFHDDNNKEIFLRLQHFADDNGNADRALSLGLTGPLAENAVLPPLGKGTPISIMPPYISLYFCIKSSGPAR